MVHCLKASDTLKELENSLRQSHTLERKMFQNELQYQINNHQLYFDIEKEKFNNEKIRRIAKIPVFWQNITGSSGKHSVGEVVRKCEGLKIILKRRDAQIRKLNLKLSAMSKQKTKLSEKLKKHQEGQGKMEGEIQILKDALQKQKSFSLPYHKEIVLEENLAEAMAGLKLLNKKNKQLSFQNDQLASQISRSRPPKKTAASQVRETDFNFTG